MKYLVNIESLDYTRQRNLENEFKTVYLKSEVNEETEIWAVVDDEKTAKKMEETIKAFNDLFK